MQGPDEGTGGLSLRGFMNLRSAVVTGLVLSYVWRHHTLSPILYPLRLAAISTVGSWAFLVFSPRISIVKRAAALPYIQLYFLWSLWIAIGTLFALDPDRTWEYVSDVHLKSLTMLLFLVGFYRTFRHVRFVVLLQLIGAGVLTFFYAKSGFPTQWTPFSTYDRNDFAMHLVMVTPFSLYMALTARGRWAKLAAWGLTGMMGISVILSQSRGGFLALLAMAVFFLSRLKRVPLRFRVLPFILLGLGVLTAPQTVKDRLNTLFDLEDDYNYQSDVGRVEVWKRGLVYWREHPVFGVGAQNFPTAEGTLSPQARSGNPNWTRRSVAHNSFLEVGAETGFVGFAFFVGMILMAFARTWRIRSRLARDVTPASTSVRHYADALLASIVGFMVAGFFLSQAYSAILISLVSLVAGLELTLEGTVPRRAPDQGAGRPPPHSYPFAASDGLKPGSPA